jgi:hypothetical protein
MVCNRTDAHVPSWAISLIPRGNVPDAKVLTQAGL